jgi:NAD(P)-dependent dehydrogenase (short-subunit alcohol dehydrogenase family)
VNISATLALAAAPGFAHYAAAKAGLLQLTRRQRWSTARAVCA